MTWVDLIYCSMPGRWRRHFKRASYHPHSPEPSSEGANLPTRHISASPENLDASEPARCEETKENHDKGNSPVSGQQTLEKSPKVQIRVAQSQHCWHLEPDHSLLWGCSVGPSRMFSNIPGLYLLDVSSIPSELWQPKKSPGTVTCLWRWGGG